MSSACQSSEEGRAAGVATYTQVKLRALLNQTALGLLAQDPFGAQHVVGCLQARHPDQDELFVVVDKRQFNCPDPIPC